MIRGSSRVLLCYLISPNIAHSFLTLIRLAPFLFVDAGPIRKKKRERTVKSRRLGSRGGFQNAVLARTKTEKSLRIFRNDSQKSLRIFRNGSQKSLRFFRNGSQKSLRIFRKVPRPSCPIPIITGRRNSSSSFVFAPPFIDLADRLRRVPRDFPVAKARTDRKKHRPGFLPKKKDDGKSRIVLKKIYTLK